MKKDPMILVKHMYDAIVDIEKFIGEAAKNLPEDFKLTHPEVLWRAISDAKNVFVHEYFDVDLNLVWQIIKGDLLELKKQLQFIKNI